MIWVGGELGAWEGGTPWAGCVGPKVQRETTAAARTLGWVQKTYGLPLGPGHSRGPLGDLCWFLPCSLQDGGTRRMR